MKRVAILLSAALSISPAVAVPALAEEASTTGSVPVASANAAEGDQNQDSSTSKTDDVASDPKEDAVATVTTTGEPGEETSYSSLEDAVADVNLNGGTLTLCQSMTNTRNEITITHANVTVTAAPNANVTFRGTILINAADCVVSGIKFINPGAAKKEDCFSNCVAIRATGATVKNCTFNVPSGVWPVMSDNYIWWQPNCVWVQATDCTITGNFFNLGRINEKNDKGEIKDSDSNVAINLVGPNVSDVTISGNTMTVLKPCKDATKGGGSCFIVAIGNNNDENAYGISGVNVLGNTFDGAGDPKYARFAGFSDAEELVITGNTVTSAYSGVYVVTYIDNPSYSSVIETMYGNNIDATNNSLVKASVDSGGHTYCFSSVSDALESDYSNSGTVKLTQNTTESLIIPVNKKVTIDLAGHTLTAPTEDVAITNSGDLTIADSVGKGTVSGTVTTDEDASLHKSRAARSVTTVYKATEASW